MAQYFSAGFAVQYGLKEAVVYQEIILREEMSRQEYDHAVRWRCAPNGVMVEENLLWTRYLCKGLLNTFPYFGWDEIVKALDSLQKNALILYRPSVTAGYLWITVLDKDGGHE